ncbi:unnamed protein product, partial [Schistosoma spindalis]
MEYHITQHSFMDYGDDNNNNHNNNDDDNNDDDDLKSHFSIIYSHEEQINHQSNIYECMIDNLHDEMNPDFSTSNNNNNNNNSNGDHNRKDSTVLNQSSLMWLDDTLDTDILPLSGLSELSSYSIPIISNNNSDNDDSNWSIWLKTCSSQSPATDRKVNIVTIKLSDEDYSIHHQEPDYAHHRHHSHHYHHHHHHCQQYDQCQNHSIDKEIDLTNEESLKKTNDTDNHIDDVEQQPQQQQQQQPRRDSLNTEITEKIEVIKNDTDNLPHFR